MNRFIHIGSLLIFLISRDTPCQLPAVYFFFLFFRNGARVSLLRLICSFRHFCVLNVSSLSQSKVQNSKKLRNHPETEFGFLALPERGLKLQRCKASDLN